MNFHEVPLCSSGFRSNPVSPSCYVLNRQTTERCVLVRLSASCGRAERREQIRAKIKLAIDELFGNICFYAYDSAPGPVTVCMENETDPLAVVISFIDKGKPYKPLEADEPDVELSGEDRPIGGLGIFLVQSTMDNLNYEYIDEQNILTFKKYLTL